MTQEQQVFNQCVADARIAARRVRFQHGREYARSGKSFLSDRCAADAQMSELEEYALTWALHYFRNEQVEPSHALFATMALFFIEAYRLPVGEENI